MPPPPPPPGAPLFPPAPTINLVNNTRLQNALQAAATSVTDHRRQAPAVRPDHRRSGERVRRRRQRLRVRRLEPGR